MDAVHFPTKTILPGISTNIVSADVSDVNFSLLDSGVPSLDSMVPCVASNVPALDSTVPIFDSAVPSLDNCEALVPTSSYEANARGEPEGCKYDNEESLTTTQ